MRAKSHSIKALKSLGVSGLAIAALGATNLAHAQETDEADQEKRQDTVVVTGFIQKDISSAMKGNVPVRDVPLSISSYGEALIDSVEAIELGDLYNYMPGVQRAGPSGYDIAIRGFQSGNEDVNSILVDGLPGLTTTQTSPPTVNVKTIDVVKGPASVLYGKVQPGGFINIITKKPEKDRHFSLGLRSLGYIGDGTSFSDSLGYTVSGDFTGGINEAGTMAYRLVAEYKDQPSFYDGAFAESTFIAPSVAFELSDKTDLLIQGEYIDATRNLYDGLVAFNLDYRNIADRTTRYSEPNDAVNEEGYGATITLDHEFNQFVKWHTAFRTVYHQDDYAGLRNRSFVNATTLRRQDRTQDNVREYNFIDTNLSINFDTGPVEHKLLLGANGGRATTDFFRLRLDNGNATTNIDIYDPVYGQYVPRVVTGQNRAATQQDTFGIYIQDQIKFSENWKAVAAVRYEDFETEGEDLLNPATPHEFVSGDQISPMFGIIYQPNDNWSIYSSYATSFNPPSPGAVDINGNIINEAELGEQIEAGVKATVLDGKVSATASVFRIDKDNVTESLGNNVFALIGGERSDGVEFEADASLADNWHLLFGYAYADSTVYTDVEPLNVGQQITNVPLHTASLFSRYEVEDGMFDGLGVTFGVSYTGDRYGTLPDALNPRLELPGYTVVDLGFLYDFDGTSLALRFNNLFDEDYFQSASNQFRIQPGAPRSVVFSIRKDF